MIPYLIGAGIGFAFAKIIEIIDDRIKEDRGDFYAIFSRGKNINSKVIDFELIDEYIKKDEILKEDVKFITERGGSVILYINSSSEKFNNLLRYRIENELGLYFKKKIENEKLLD